MKVTTFRTALGLAVLALVSSNASAALSVSSAFPAGSVLASDNSAERLIDRDLDGVLSEGDSLRGIFSIDNVTGTGGPIAIGAGTAYNELTGLFQVRVKSKVLVQPAVGPVPARYNFAFEFDPLFGQGVGVVGVLYDDAAQNFRRENCGGLNDFAACEATAIGGGVWATVGFGTDGFWSATNAVDNTALGATLPLTTPLGSFAMALDFITNNTGYQWNNVNCFDQATFTIHTSAICAQGGVLASGRSVGGANTPYDIFDDVNFTMNRVPEPASLALVGMALVGLGVARSKKRAA